MTTQFDILKKSRDLVLLELKDLNLEQIHQIPQQFKNNIAWNVAHLVVTQQLLHYALSGLPTLCSDALIADFRKGTSAAKIFTADDFETVKNQLIDLPLQLEKDYEKGIFTNYKTYPTSTGFVLDSIESAITFNNFHEGIHYGIIRSIKKFV
ncbi:MAG: DinB family protein [Polaribacter sp.]|nr:DinB family protein [Polaribacter sp.]